MTVSTGTRLGPYEILSLLGRGGMGEVYRSYDARLSREVAIKILPPEIACNPVRRARFEREARAIAQLSHSNICAIYDVGEIDGVVFLVMEYIKGESLDARLRRSPLPWATAVSWGLQIASAIDAAHRRGIVHRDLKPANVMLGESGVKLLDFGLAKLLDGSDAAATQSAQATTSLTSEQKVIGTLHYMSPEQLEGREVDPRTDVFAFGTTLYEMLTGKHAFDGASPASITAAILTADPAPVAALVSGDAIAPAALDHVIRRALAKDPDDRWQSARDMIIELQWILDGRSQRTTPVRSKRRSRQRIPALAAAAAALLTVGAALGWSLRTPRPLLDQPVTILSITAPEGTHLDPGFEMLAVSPVGRNIAFLAGPTGGPTRIYVRSLDKPDPRVLLGTEGADNPFWSPDGRSVGYVSNGHISRVGIDNDSPVVVVDLLDDAVPYMNPSPIWMADDTIVYQRPDGWYRVSAFEGKPARFVTEEVNGGWAGALPDRRFLTLFIKPGRTEYELHVTGLDGHPEARLPSIKSNAEFAAGYLLSRTREGILVAQTFDQRSLKLSGQPISIAAGVQLNIANGRAEFSASDEVLAYRLDVPLRLTWRDRTGAVIESIGELGRDANPVLARDGRTVAADRYAPAQDQFRIVTIDERGHSTTVTHGPKDRFPMWASGGDQIVYSTTAANQLSDLRRARADGSGDELLLASAGFVPLDWSRDGHLVLQDQIHGNLFIWSPSEGGKPRPLTETPSAKKTARFSPDSHWIAYASGVGNQSDIWIQPFPKGEAKPRQVSAGGGIDPAWKADGKELYYMTSDGSITAVPVIVSGDKLSTGAPVRLFGTDPGRLNIQRHSYAVSPDGQRFLTNERVASNDSITVVVHWTSLVK